MFFLLSLLLCVFMLSSCDSPANGQVSPSPAPGEDSPDPTQNQPHETASVPTPDGFYFVFRGNTVRLDADIDDVLAALGTPQSTFDLPSCAFEGIDRFFLFPGMQLQTYPIGGRDRVHTIMFTDDSVTTVNGIYLGSTLDQVFAAYGHEYDYSYGMYTFTRGKTMLRFNVNDSEVQTILYELITD